MWKWLVSNGLYKDILAVVVMAIAAKVVRIGKVLKDVMDKLDTTTPGGLAEIVKAVEAERKQKEEKTHPPIHRHR